MTRLADAGKTVLLETSGAVDTVAVDPRVRIILDIKTPGSGEADANVWCNLDRLKPTDEVKVVVCDRNDFDWAAGIVRDHGLVGRCPVLFSAAFGSVNPTELASWILEPASRCGSSSSSTRSSGTPRPAGSEGGRAWAGPRRPVRPHQPRPGRIPIHSWTSSMAAP